jgi:uncharacterized membrane protein YvlD (DUF360 family)
MDKPKIPLLKQPLFRVLLIWAVQTTALLIMVWLMDSVVLDDLGAGVVAVAAIGLLNALLWPLLSYVLVPFALLTLGLAALLLNGFMVWLAAQIVPGFSVASFWAAFWLSLGMALINLILSSLLTIDDENSWNRNAVKRQMRRAGKTAPTVVPGILFLEIDGLAAPILQQAIDNGFMPNLKRWLDSGSHVLRQWEPDTSSQTSASQAGILHGDNSEIPAFRWYDKASGQVVSSSNPRILPELEKERSNGNGLLSNDGASRGNMFSGDAPHVMGTASVVTDRTKFHSSEYRVFFANPYSVARTLYLVIWDIIQEKRQYRWARKNNVRPILDKKHRGGTYPFIRAFNTVIMPSLNLYTLLGDVMAGRSSAYATFVSYDEIAHHSGILDPGCFDILNKMDNWFARLETAAKEAPRPYHLVVLSDHGQTGGATFKQRYGLTLQDYVQALMAEGVSVAGQEYASDEGTANLNTFLNDAVRNDTSTASRVAKRALVGQTVDGHIILGEQARQEAKKTADQKDGTLQQQPDVIAVASGNLGIVSFTQWPKRTPAQAAEPSASTRLTKEEIDQAFPAVISGLVQHEGIGFIMVRSEKDGALAIGAKGVYYLDEDRVEGENPLAVFGPNAASHLRRTDSFDNCPDILVNSFYDPEKNEGCAFEELIGFHGGLGGTQSQPFILYPAELPAPDNDLIGAASIYHLGKSWLDAIQKGPTNGTQSIAHMK